MQPIVLINKNKISVRNESNYIFRGAQGVCHWPKQYGRGLGQCGLWNFLWRVGFHPQQMTIEQLPNADKIGILFVDKVYPLDEPTLRALHRWQKEGGKIIATGELQSWISFLPQDYDWKTVSFNNPYAACAYLISDYSPQLIAPPKWNFIEYEGSPNTKFFTGYVAAVQGERQTPERAHLLVHQKSPAIIHQGLFYYFNSHPFSAFQAWLQGQENLSPWLGWRHRLFWLDEWVSFFYGIMCQVDIFKSNTIRPGMKTLGKTTVVLRHDLDHSRDTTFLQEEDKKNVAATHAILKDRNTQFWVKKLAVFKNQEMAFHYHTGKRNWLGLITQLFTKKSLFSYLPAPKQIARLGLLKQLKWATKQGIDVQTLHRHLCFLIYPEWIDAMDHIFDSDFHVLGSSSLFRGHILRWGIDRIEGNQGFLSDWPDAQFPLWYPFRLAHAGKDGKILNGWEMTSLMDIEPHLFSQLLDYKIPHIAQNVFTLIYHPAHANQNTFYQQGSLNHFESILTILKEREINAVPMKKIFHEANSILGSST